MALTAFCIQEIIDMDVMDRSNKTLDIDSFIEMKQWWLPLKYPPKKKQ